MYFPRASQRGCARSAVMRFRRGRKEERKKTCYAPKSADSIAPRRTPKGASPRAWPSSQSVARFMICVGARGGGDLRPASLARSPRSRGEKKKGLFLLPCRDPKNLLCLVHLVQCGPGFPPAQTQRLWGPLGASGAVLHDLLRGPARVRDWARGALIHRGWWPRGRPSPPSRRPRPRRRPRPPPRSSSTPAISCRPAAGKTPKGESQKSCHVVRWHRPMAPH